MDISPSISESTVIFHLFIEFIPDENLGRPPYIRLDQVGLLYPLLDQAPGWLVSVEALTPHIHWSGNSQIVC
jgi:hypothetical protein